MNYQIVQLNWGEKKASQRGEKNSSRSLLRALMGSELQAQQSELPETFFKGEGGAKLDGQSEVGSLIAKSIDKYAMRNVGLLEGSATDIRPVEAGAAQLSKGKIAKRNVTSNKVHFWKFRHAEGIPAQIQIGPTPASQVRRKLAALSSVGFHPFSMSF